jgi:hypothetical protein
MAVDTRHRDKNGEISRKHGNTLIRTLRKTYGPGFAGGCADDAKLSDVLTKLDETSLSHLIHDHEAGYLEQICRS